jgi:hypothetical protein
MHAGVEQSATLGMLDQVGWDRERHRSILSFDHILQTADQATAGHGIEFCRHEVLASLPKPSTHDRRRRTTEPDHRPWRFPRRPRTEDIEGTPMFEAAEA